MPLSGMRLAHGLIGTFFAHPKGEGPFPTISILGGSEGGDSAARQKALYPAFTRKATQQGGNLAAIAKAGQMGESH